MYYILKDIRFIISQAVANFDSYDLSYSFPALIQHHIDPIYPTDEITARSCPIILTFLAASK